QQWQQVAGDSSASRSSPSSSPSSSSTSLLFPRFASNLDILPADPSRIVFSILSSSSSLSSLTSICLANPREYYLLSSTVISLLDSISNPFANPVYQS